MDLIYQNLLCYQHLFLRTQMTVILSFFITRDFRRTPNQTDSDVTLSRSCDQGKIAKEN